MTEISIEIPSNYDPNIIDLLESLRTQSFQDYEVIVATYSSELKDLIKDYDVKIATTIKSGTLYRRAAAHDLSKGKKILMLESSRYLHRDCLLEINRHNQDMMILEEEDVENNLIAKIQNIERSLGVSKIGKLSPETLIIEPRVFAKNIADIVFDKIKLIDPIILKNIQFGDLDIIYYEAFRVSQNLIAIDSPLIYHHTDLTIFELVKKYYRYGQSNRLLKRTPYSGKFKARSHLRPNYGLKESVEVYALWSIKAISFVLGQYISYSPPEKLWK